VTPPREVTGVPTPAPLDARFDEARLRDGLAQLARGLGKLHAHNMVHRDIKSSNVLVTQEGRVVILDFGLVAEAQRAEDEGLVGTVSCMAPEQAAGLPAGLPADWYSVGVVLYQTLTGRSPFLGPPPDVLLQKQVQDPPSPRTLLPSVPADLDALCMDLLQRDPARRPTAAEVLRRLHQEADSEPVALADVFIGRRREHEILWQAYEKGQAAAVVVQGESGVGKSTLVRHFVAGVLEKVPEAVALAGRCYERESVPYKAVDGVMDALSRHLRDTPERADLIPPEAAVLGQVFPVLRPYVPEPSGQEEDPARLRGRMFAALRELMGRMAERGPLIVSVDDLQWADADSLQLLTELMRPPDAPRLLLLATVRRSHEAPTGLPPPWYAISGNLTPLTLDALLPDEATELARLLGATDAEKVAREAGGHPLFIDELVRQPGHADNLDDALWARIQRQEEAARHFLEIVALAGTPVDQESAAGASSLELDELQRVTSHLRGAHLTRTTGPRPTDLIECYHDRVREAIGARVSPERRRELHGRLAAALVVTGRATPEELAAHFREAGDVDKAAWYSAEAAARAADALAFDRAARLYRQAIELRPLSGAGGRSLQVALGEALANAGRGGEAAEAFRQAAASIEPKSGGDEAAKLELQRRAAEQLLRAGHIDEGMERLREVLDAVGVPMARTPRRALMSLLWSRARLRMRGLWFKPKREEEISPEVLAHVDVTWSAAIGMAMVDTVRGADFQARCLVLALQSGEPRRITKALALEAANNSAAGWPARKRTAKLLEMTHELATHLASPYATGLLLGTSGVAAFLEGRWKDARKLCERAEATFRDRCVGAAWELDNVNLFHLWSLVYLGEIRELNLRMPRTLREAESRGDRFMSTSVRTGDLAYWWLCAGDPDGALAAADESMRRWTKQGFLHQHWDDLLARCEIDLYRGDGKAAIRRMEERWKSLSDSFLLLIQISRTEAHFLRARSAIVAWGQSFGDEKERLLKIAEKDTRKLARENSPWGPALAILLRALLTHLRGGDGTAKLLEAEEALQKLDMQLHARVVRRQRGILTGDKLLVEDADAWLRGQEVKEPSLLAAMLAPLGNISAPPA
jgi:tetratricopeptide (TPR) repeat protein